LKRRIFRGNAGKAAETIADILNDLIAFSCLAAETEVPALTLVLYLGDFITNRYHA
jgi:hypothetical protein